MHIHRPLYHLSLLAGLPLAGRLASASLISLAFLAGALEAVVPERCLAVPVPLLFVNVTDSNLLPRHDGGECQDGCLPARLALYGGARDAAVVRATLQRIEGGALWDAREGCSNAAQHITLGGGGSADAMEGYWAKGGRRL